MLRTVRPAVVVELVPLVAGMVLLKPADVVCRELRYAQAGAKIDALMKEQDRNNSNRVKKGTGARTGQISGADALMTGDITIFGRDDKHKKVSGGGIFGAGIGAIANARTTDKAVVAIDYRFVDAETSEILSTQLSLRTWYQKFRILLKHATPCYLPLDSATIQYFNSSVKPVMRDSKHHALSSSAAAATNFVHVRHSSSRVN